ncbi:hypothetical protein GW17_00024214 [Ensete ventricosum]|nr:hypothetical protein GW17_00024214 [Ensete ventricosum]RZS17416.1 hypothetical protein BHM03_00049556 [Ensete ventricosum]
MDTFAVFYSQSQRWEGALIESGQEDDADRACGTPLRVAWCGASLPYDDVLRPNESAEMADEQDNERTRFKFGLAVRRKGGGHPNAARASTRTRTQRVCQWETDAYREFLERQPDSGTPGRTPYRRWLMCRSRVEDGCRPVLCVGCGGGKDVHVGVRVLSLIPRSILRGDSVRS